MMPAEIFPNPMEPIGCTLRPIIMKDKFGPFADAGGPDPN